MVDKLRIEGYLDDHFTKKSGVFVAQVNPASYSETLQVRYQNDYGIDSAGSTPLLKGLEPRALNLDLTIDATGAVPGATQTVKQRLDNFKSVVYSFEKNIHRPKFLWILWGVLSVHCVIETYTVDYGLFDPSGIPLRAKLSAAFIGYDAPDTIELDADKKSADLTHRRQVRDGDTLPLLCAQVYGDSKYYPRVAKHNGLVNFRALTPGIELDFPPLQRLDGGSVGR